MDFNKIIESRHSVRQYTQEPIEEEKRNILNSLISQINEKAGLHIQIFYNEPKCFDSFMAHYGKFSGVNNYITLVGKKSDNLDELLGYYGEMLILKAEEMGLNTCWVAMTHGKSKAIVEKGEKAGCIIPIGYAQVEGVAHKSKNLSEVSNYSSTSPEWFKKGVEAALLAPTAMNQQKFYFELLPDGSVKAKAGKGFYTKVDLGIAKYHFETAVNKKVK